ncbi:MAG: riboflavin synthase, partial [Calditrichaeota bacterium]
MFTGLIEEVGRVAGRRPIQGGIRLTIAAERVLEDLKVGDSIAVNGVCLTVVKQR